MGGSSIYSKDDFDLWTKDAEDAITLRLDTTKWEINGSHRIGETKAILAAVDIQVVDIEWYQGFFKECDTHIEKRSRALHRAVETIIEKNGEAIFQEYLKELEEIEW